MPETGCGVVSEAAGQAALRHSEHPTHFQLCKIHFSYIFFCQEPTHSLQYPRIKERFPVDMARGCLRAVIGREENVTGFMAGWRNLRQLGSG